MDCQVIFEQLQERAQSLIAYSVALDKSTDETEISPLAIFFSVDDKIEVTEELLSLCPMHGCTTAIQIFQQLCGAIERFGVPWNRLVGITMDEALSMTGRTGCAGAENISGRTC